MSLRPDAPKRIYVASSWRNPIQTAVVAALRSAGIDCYDFKHPHGPASDGFHWSEVMPSFDQAKQQANVDEYIQALENPIAIEGFGNDFGAMQECDACVIVLPCGKSAHAEAGWFAGQHRRVWVLLDPDENDMVQPELMYKMFTGIAPTLFDLLGMVGVED
jgi:hypothetical protein